MLITSNTNEVFYEVTKLKSKPKNTNLRNYLKIWAMITFMHQI